jgi:hypothetical protein
MSNIAHYASIIGMQTLCMYLASVTYACAMSCTHAATLLLSGRQMPNGLMGKDYVL